MKWILSEQKLFFTSEVRKTCDKYHHFFPAANCGKEKCISVHFLWENIHMLTFPPLKIGFQKSLILAIVADLVDSIASLRFLVYIISIVYCIFYISFIEAVFTWDSFYQAFPFSLPISPRHHKSDNIFTENKLADGKFSYICVKLKCGNFSCTRIEAVICYCRQVI